MSAEKTCGTCGLWEMNRALPGMFRGKICCADIVMDLPASFIPNRQTMEAHEGDGCICWEAIEVKS